MSREDRPVKKRAEKKPDLKIPAEAAGILAAIVDKFSFSHVGVIVRAGGTSAGVFHVPPGVDPREWCNQVLGNPMTPVKLPLKKRKARNAKRSVP